MATTSQTPKAVVQRGFEALNDRDRDAFVEVHSGDVVMYSSGETVDGLDAVTETEFGLFDAFSDMIYTIDALVGEGDLVAVRWTATGTHDGELDGIAATGETIEIAVMGMFRVEDGEITAVWIVPDQLRLFQQLGVVDTESL